MEKTQYVVLASYAYDEEPYGTDMICKGIFDDKQEALDFQAKLIENEDIEFVHVYESHKL